MTDYFLIILRYIVAAMGGGLVVHGLVKPEDMPALSDAGANILLGGIVWAVPVLWGLWRNRLKPRLEALLASHHIISVQVTPDVAAKVPDDKIVAAPVIDGLKALNP